jgi:hypothetical protein
MPSPYRVELPLVAEPKHAWIKLSAVVPQAPGTAWPRVKQEDS